MRHYFTIGFTLTLLSGVSYAGIIAHTDYTAGSVITSAGQNTNENTIVNEVNGNLSAANLASNAVTTAKITDANVTLAKLDTVLQSTFSFVNSMMLYQSPNLTYISASTIDIEANTGTANETCLTFVNEVRCVTENTSSTSQYRRMIVSETASLIVTHNSGLLATEVLTANSWLAVYAVKTTDDATKFVLVCSTMAPVQANFATLNTKFGINGYLYLGVVRYGDDATATTSLMKFTQNGPSFRFTGAVTNNIVKTIGLSLVDTLSGTASTYTYTGAMIGANSIAPYLKSVSWGVYTSADTQPSQASDTTNAIIYLSWKNQSGTEYRTYIEQADASAGVATSGASSINRILSLVGYIDPVLARSPSRARF